MRTLGYVGAQSASAADWLDFGPRVFGFEARQSPDGTVLVRWCDRAYRLAIHPGGPDRLLYLGWDLGDEAALAEAAARAASAGFAVERGGARLAAERSVRRIVWFTDTFGLRHELFVGQEEEPGSYRGQRPSSRAVTGDLGLGFVALRVPDLQRGLDFYRDVMGMRVSDAINLGAPFGEMWFLRCNRRHHSVALLEGGDALRLEHLMIEAATLEEVEIAWDLARREMDAFVSPGRRLSDNMFLFRVSTPTGFRVCYGWGASQVDDEENWIPRYIDSSRAGGIVYSAAAVVAAPH
ncbi:iron-dependent extradiol dioxygenase [Acrocarpospora corrugata]|uniref:Iron-dependent extradiol dioxygenase n=1 Tax=Acrocarpospora corrugata TaxID=35763 RepID=A0A5M3VSI6_9ACTN|nr:VOC family protein [Acrocarpospora corrugata]GER99168.1 iron-dependent extradiol dioxygenase [Acrocarpospora corrugata]